MTWEQCAKKYKIDIFCVEIAKIMLSTHHDRIILHVFEIAIAHYGQAADKLTPGVVLAAWWRRVRYKIQRKTERFGVKTCHVYNDVGVDQGIVSCNGR